MARSWLNIFDFLRRRLPFRKTPKKARDAVRLEIETLENRSLMTATASGVVSGIAFLDSNGTGVYDASTEPLLPGVQITLAGTATFGSKSVNVTAVTDDNGAFAFQNVLPGTYQLTAGADPALIDQSAEIFGVSAPAGVQITSATPVTGGETVTQNAGFQGGLAPDFISLTQFLTETTPADFLAGTGGSGVALANSRPNNAPIISNQIAAVTLSSTTPTDTIDLAGKFSDPDYADTQVTFNITNGGTPETLHVTLFDAAAPQNVANFLDYVKSGAYNNSVFTRLASGFVLQGGGATESTSSAGTTLTSIPALPDVPNEWSAANPNAQYTLAMAESSSPNSANNQFFFNLADNTSLDSVNSSNNTGPFTVFGAVTDSASQAALNTLAVTPVTDESSTTFASANPSLLLNAIPLSNYAGGANDPNFPTDATPSNLMVINSVTIDSQPEFLTYSLVSNSNPTLVSTSFQNEQLTLTQGTGSGSATIVVQAMDSLGATVTQSFTVTVNPIATTTAVTASTDAPVFGQTVDLTANVTPVTSGAVSPTGTVTFLDGATTLGTGTLGSDDSATLPVSNLAVGGHTITASYAGDTNFTGGSSPGASVTVSPADTTTAASVSTPTADFGQTVTLTAVVNPVSPGAGVPTGTVTFLDGGSSIGTGTLDGTGTATLTLSNLAAGDHTITASYATDGNFNSSTSSSPGVDLNIT